MKTKFKRLLKGEKVITNDKELDILQKMADDKNVEIRSLPNPQRLGFLDQYIAWISR